ncbi:hypothetical protein O3M35_002032 [Rhynocoris fuscipes]|uniref:GPI ethanolamine phosphate transferase 1 n=1 Tax=Rhynocoris fuscipes TaxID=488301 RepID=A0AAW1CXM2_9HEMI
MVWITICFLLCITIILIGYELVHTSNALQGSYQETLSDKFINLQPPARRLVIFLVDSMTNNSADEKWISKIIGNSSYGRADVLVSKPITRAALVAIFSGHYEHILMYLPWFNLRKVSDTVFKNLSNTYYFGPQIVSNYFKAKNVWSDNTYKKYVKFGDEKNIGDNYVFEKIKNTFSKPNSTLKETKLFYIHFTSVNVVSMICRRVCEQRQKVIDEVAYMIKNIVKIISNTFNDDKTVFMIISDHSTHADSLKDEIITPLIIWGKHIVNGRHQMIEQIDLCPLIASLLGISIPVNSLGLFHHEFLDIPLSSMAYSFMYSAIQQTELCYNTWKQIEKGVFVKRILERTMTKCNYKNYLKILENLMINKNYTNVIKTSVKLTKSSKYCIKNIQNFYKSSLLFVLLMSYFAWIFGTICMMTTEKTMYFNSRTGKVLVFITCIGYLTMTVISITSIILEGLPHYYIIFAIIPSIAWLMITLNSGFCVKKLMRMKYLTIISHVIFVLGIVEFTYWAKYYPFLFCFYLIPYACIILAKNHNYLPYHVSVIYIITSIALVILPSFPVIGLPESPIFLNLSATFWIIASLFYCYLLDFSTKQGCITIGMIAVTCLSIWIIDLTYLGTKLQIKFLSWFILFLPITTYFGSLNLAERLLQIVISVGAPYLLLSTRHELLVLMIFAFNLYALLRIETSIPFYKYQNFINGITLYYYIILGIFASGNEPYLSSCDILITRVFTSTPNDIQIAVLSFYKISITLMVILSFFSAMCLYMGKGLRLMFLIITVTSAVSSARHSLGIIISNDPMYKLSEFLLGNILYLLLFLPFTFVPLFLNIKTIKK